MYKENLYLITVIALMQYVVWCFRMDVGVLQMGMFLFWMDTSVLLISAYVCVGEIRVYYKCSPHVSQMGIVYCGMVRVHYGWARECFGLLRVYCGCVRLCL